MAGSREDRQGSVAGACVATELERVILNELLGQSRMALPIPGAKPASTQAPLAGHYLLANPRDRLLRIADYLWSRIEVRADSGGGLSLITPEGERFRYVPSEASGQYRRHLAPTADLFAGLSQNGVPFIQTQGKYYEQQPPLGFRLFSILIFLARWLLIPFAIFVLATITFTTVKGKKADALFFSRIFPFLAVPMLFLALRIYGSLEFGDLGFPGPGTWSIFILSLLAPLSCFMGLFFQLRSLPQKEFLPVRIISFFASLLSLGLLYYLWSFDLLGLRLWAY